MHHDPDVAAALAKPGVAEALQDPKIQAVLGALRNARGPRQSAEITANAQRDPDVARKLRTLVEAGVLGVQR